MRGMAEPDRGEALAWYRRPSPPRKSRQNDRFSSNAQRRLQRVAMAEIMGLFGQGQLRLAALQLDRSAGRHQQARDQAQQRGLAGSIAGR